MADEEEVPPLRFASVGMTLKLDVQLLDLLGLQHALHGGAQVLDRAVDHRVRTDLHALALGGATGANYTTDYRTFQGISMPTKRRIYAYDDAMQKVADPLLVSLDFGELSFS